VRIFLRNNEGNSRGKGIRNGGNRNNLKIYTLEDILINNRVRWYKHILRMNEYKTTKKDLKKISAKGQKER
jgi:hypothetical protein